MLPKAILFDLDDTIISFDGVTNLAWEKACSSFVSRRNTLFNSDVLLESINKIRKLYWSDPERHRIGRMDLIKARRNIVKIALRELQYFDEVSAYEIADDYSKLHKEMICLFPDSISTLKELKDLGIRMALVTNGTSEMQLEKINRFCLSEFFDFYLIEEEVGFGKPDIRVFEMALERFGLRADQVWMVGDNLVWDIEAPQKVGIFSVWNDYKKKGISISSTIVPDKIINNISELLI
jgi:putative hydrolase of the HAD superfamily